MREIWTRLTRRRGEASVLWFRKTLAASVDSTAVLNDEQETAKSITVSPGAEDEQVVRNQ